MGTIGPDCCSVSQGEFENCDLASEDTRQLYIHTSMFKWFRNSNVPAKNGWNQGMCPRSYVYRRKEQDDSLFDYLMICLGVTMNKY